MVFNKLLPHFCPFLKDASDLIMLDLVSSRHLHTPSVIFNYFQRDKFEEKGPATSHPAAPALHQRPRQLTLLAS